MQSKALEKFVTTVSAESHLNPAINGEIATICMFELIRLQFGQRHNLYPIARVPWDRADHPLVIRECEFYSALATLIMSNPICAGLVKEGTIGRAASS